MDRSRRTILDLIRGLAALEVLFNHVRDFVFVPRLPQASLPIKVFYILTNYGHQSVVVFFVLSGYLVGGSILAGRQEGFWVRYSVQRLSRLWIVLVPCLLATLLWDTLGWHTGGAEYLKGGLNPPILSAPEGHSVYTDLVTFAGNALFLQTIAVPVFGSNAPLWSLANEFWYYVLFPILWCGMRRTPAVPAVTRCLFLAAGVAILVLLPWGIITGFLAWLAGVAAFTVQRSPGERIMGAFWFGIPSLAGCAVLFFFKASDIVLGLALAASLPFLLRLPLLPRMLAAFSTWLSEFSYTLYLAHFPLAAFLWYTLCDAQRLEPSPIAFGRFGTLVVFLVGYSFAMSLLFERNTDRLRRYVMGLLAAPKPNQ